MKTKAFFYIAFTGTVLSLVVHIAALMNIPVQIYFPPVMILHVWLFVSFVPAVLLTSKNPELKKFNRGSFNPIQQLKNFGKIMPNAPKGFVYLLPFVMIYVILNFLFFIQGIAGEAEIIDGQYYLTSRGDILKSISEKEFYSMKSNFIRGFSGHWILFNYVATLILWPKKEGSNEKIS